MSSSNNNIEEFFLKIILKTSFVGVILVTLADFIFKSEKATDNASHIVDISILVCFSVAIVLNRMKKHKASVIAATFFPLLSLFYSTIFIPHSHSAMIAIFAIGFIISILLDGISKSFMHGYIAAGMAVVLFFQLKDPVLYEKHDSNEVFTSFIIYMIVYFVITYSASALKEKYNSINLELLVKNQELIEKGKAIEKQNKELIASENKMNEINAHLEQIVEERTNNVKSKNAYLVKYAFANAHHVRGPLARILGLLQLAKMEQQTDYPFILDKIAQQAAEIDEVLKNINKELEEGQDIFF